MISLISPALIMGSPASGLDEPFFDAGELAVEAAVDDVRADLGDEAAEQISVELLFQDHLAGAHPLSQTCAERVALGLRERHGRPHAGADAAGVPVDEIAVRL